jgi:DNA-binding HxlR family transcriptional regulator
MKRARAVLAVIWILLAMVPTGAKGTATSEPEAIRLQIDQEISRVSGRKSVDFLRSMRRFSDKKTMLVVRALATKRLGFRELLDETALSTSLLNHTLTEMKNADLILQSEIDGKYALTKFAVQMLSALKRLKAIIQDTPEDKLFASAELGDLLALLD